MESLRSQSSLLACSPLLHQPNRHSKWLPYLQQLIRSGSLAECMKSKEILSQHIPSCQSTKSRFVATPIIKFQCHNSLQYVWVPSPFLIGWNGSDSSSAYGSEYNQKEQKGSRVLGYFYLGVVGSLVYCVWLGDVALCTYRSRNQEVFWTAFCCYFAAPFPNKTGAFIALHNHRHLFWSMPLLHPESPPAHPLLFSWSGTSFSFYLSLLLLLQPRPFPFSCVCVSSCSFHPPKKQDNCIVYSIDITVFFLTRTHTNLVCNMKLYLFAFLLLFLLFFRGVFAFFLWKRSRYIQ